MPTITIDGKEIAVDAGKTIIQAADEAGVDIPRYCYHAGLSIVGQCRICLVEVEKMPKLQVACYCPVGEGMVVHTRNERVKKARQQVLEFLLVNHPIDCPVCDQAGECFLQDYYMKYGLYDSKMLEDKVKKSKALDIGTHIVLDSERCILCTRCVRFCDEISKTSELGIFNRGDHAELLPQPGKRLDNPYSVNTADICPVGALTEKDFRFKTRVWYLNETNSVCAGCSTGCNISVHTNKKRDYKNDGRRVTRLKPRYNGEVNDFWMCDHGRYSFRYVDDETRISTPLQKVDGAFQEVEWDEALEMVASKIQATLDDGKQVRVLGSAKMTNEDLFVLKRFSNEVLGQESFPVTVKPKEKPFSDDFLIREDKNPNTKGAADFGLDTKHDSTAKLLDECTAGKVEVLIVFHHNLEEGFDAEIIEKALAGVDTVIFVGSNTNSTSAQAKFVLPACTYLEKDGTFTNFAGRVQNANKAVDTLDESQPEWTILRKLAKRFSVSFAYFEAEDVFADISDTVSAFKDLSYGAIGDNGANPKENGKLVSTQKTEVV